MLYQPLITQGLSASDLTTGTLNDARVAESNVTQYEDALTITESQISDLGDYVSVDAASFESDTARTDLSLRNTSASPNATFSRQLYFALNDAAEDTLYCYNSVFIADDTDGSEDATYQFRVMVDGTMTERLRLDSEGVLVKGVLSGTDLIELPSYTVANLPTPSNPSVAYASDGRKNGEGAAGGTGVMVFWDGSNWIACDSGQTVAA